MNLSEDVPTRYGAKLLSLFSEDSYRATCLQHGACHVTQDTSGRGGNNNKKNMNYGLFVSGFPAVDVRNAGVSTAVGGLSGFQGVWISGEPILSVAWR